ncbi:hypothetical protein ACJ41O_004569 [Fusarium nematophilum]
MTGYDYYDDDDYYGGGCCIGCCRAGDFGTHDGCGPCYCRRTFKPDYDRTIYPGWSLGHYYPGDEDWAESSSNVISDQDKAAEHVSANEKVPEKETSEKKPASTKGKEGSKKHSKKPKAEKSPKTSKDSRSASKDPDMRKQSPTLY